MKGQIEAVGLPLLLLFLFLFSLITAYTISEQNFNTEVVAQTEASLTEFKALTAMNTFLRFEQGSPKTFFAPENDQDEEHVEHVEITAENLVFDNNDGPGQDTDYFMDLEDTDIEVGEREGKLVKSIYVPSPEGPKELRVGADR